jgi:hypothetical protein
VSEIPKQPKFKKNFREDFGCAVTYFRDNLKRIKRVLEAREKSRKEGDIFIARQLLEFSAVLSVSALEGYCAEKLREITHKEPDRDYSRCFPTGWIKAFRKLACIEMFTAEPESSRKRDKLKILAEKRHCIIHCNSKVPEKRKNNLGQEVFIGETIPLDDAEILRVIKIMKECVLRVETKYKSPVDWGQEGLTWLQDC